jgi:hypothetical protein
VLHGRRRVLAAVLTAAVVLVGFVAFLTRGDGGDKADGRKELEAYEGKLLPLVQEWGKIEVQGMRPAIADLQLAGTPAAQSDPNSDDVVVPPEGIAGEARAWRAGFVELRKKIADVPAPPALARAKLLFDRAIVRYIDAATIFERAADGPVDQRKAGIDKGIAAARDGAALYNDASLVLQAARKRVGLPPSKDFPNHKAGEEKVSG